MNTKRCLLSLVLTAITACAAVAQDAPLWLRYPAISPDGQTIAFAYKGDLFLVPVTGGEARQLTTNAAYDACPVWSPDGTQIAFASDREGSMDVYVVSARGGIPTRLTTGSGNETPMAWSDAGHVLYRAQVMPTARSIVYSQNDFPQVYEVSVKGGRPRLFSVITMEDLSIRANGDLLYHDSKGYEDYFRKHHQSAITRDIWMVTGRQGDKKTGKQEDWTFTKLTTFRGEDRTPVWAAGEDAFYYLTERDGTFNVWKRTLDGKQEQQLTRHKGNPVRFLTAAKDGTLCYAYDGELYTYKNGQERKVGITIAADRQDRDLVRQLLTTGATEISLSPDGKEIAFIAHGDVYVTSVDYKTTKQVTNTPEQERNVAFAPDGRSLAYASERGGVWQLYESTIANKDEKQFAYASQLTEHRLTETDRVSQQPKYSPDGKLLAYWENRGDLRVMDVKTRQVRTVLDGKFNYSYSDGDLWFEWSPDSRWLLSSYIGTGGWNSPDVALVSATGAEVHNLTNSGYSDSNGKWALGGRAMLFTSDRAGYRSHGSWGAEDDVYLMFFDIDAYDRFRMTKEEKGIYDEQQKKAGTTDKSGDGTAKESQSLRQGKAGKSKSGKSAEKAATPKPLEFDLENAKDRIVRLTANSCHLGDAVLSPKGDTLYYQASFEDGYDLWKHDFLEQKTELVLKDVGSGSMQADKQFKTLFLCNKTIKKVDLGKKKTETVGFEAPFNWQPYQERQYLFDHVWRQVKEKFYDTNLHGVDWQALRETYERFLPHISNNYDMRDLLSEMLGELNGSHTGARYYPAGASLKTAHLGLFLDPDYEGDGLRVEEVIKRGPFAVRKTGVKAGDIIEAIDGHVIMQGEDYNWMLDGKAGKPVRVTVRHADGKTASVVVKPVSQAQLDELLYKRWTDRNKHLVDSLSGGRVAYVHVKAMNSENFRKVYSELLSDEMRNREAVIVDERCNGGGWLHDDLCTLLSGRQYHRFMPNGKYVGRDPYNKWVGRSCVLMNEDCYSNGSGFPWVYRELGIGKLIGTPVAGTATSVWWERLMDSSMVFGIPQVGKKDKNDHWMENQELWPDIEVYNTPEDIMTGHDRQLEAAIQEMLKK